MTPEPNMSFVFLETDEFRMYAREVDRGHAGDSLWVIDALRSYSWEELCGLASFLGAQIVVPGFEVVG